MRLFAWNQQKGNDMAWFFRRLAGSRACALGVAVCAGLATASLASAAGSFDGTYRGTERTIRSTPGPTCAHIDQDNYRVVVTNNHFVEHWAGTALEVDVAADGSFHATAPFATGRYSRVLEIKGSITGNSMEADFGSEFCAGHLSLKRS
jgi:hypothetical protein